jgi:hypothetical protein
MKLCIKHKKGLIKKYQLDILKDFILLLQNEKPLKGDLTIEFLEKRTKDMTTGQFSRKKSRIRVLFRDRMLADVLRTLSHEWAHSYDHQKLKIKDRKDIGGESEDYANQVSGELTKKFIRTNTKLHNKIFD